MFLNAPFIFRIGSVQQTLDFERAEDWMQELPNWGGWYVALSYSLQIQKTTLICLSKNFPQQFRCPR